MNDKQIRSLSILFIAIVAFLIVVRQIFKIMELSLKDYPKFIYKGKTPKKDWYTYVTPIAKAVGKEYGIPWQAICVQTALETGWGKSSLLLKFNNWAGIKSTKGQPSVQLGTTEFYGGTKTTIVDSFRVWNSPYEGLKGYAEFIHKNKRYATALKYPNDPYKYIEEIKKAGYATAPDYVSVLHGMLKSNFA
jgi:flagellar protein FlgJ